MCLLGEFTRQGSPWSSFLPLLLALTERLTGSGGSEGWRLRAGPQTRASHGGQAGSVSSDLRQACRPDGMRAEQGSRQPKVTHSGGRRLCKRSAF